MPLKGFVCSETKNLSEDKREISFEDCIACAETTENACNFTAALLRILSQLGEKHEITVTSILGCLRNTYLSRKHDYFAEPGELYWLYRGRLAHKVLEDAVDSDTQITETEFKRKIDDIEIYGTPDIILPKKRLIRDYKTCAEVPKYRQDKPYSNHIQQLNIYAWVVSGQDKGRKNGKEVIFDNPLPEIKRLQVTYLDMKNVKTTDAPLYKKEKVEEFLRLRAPVLKEALDNGIVPPKEDTWQCGYCNVVKICQRLYEEELFEKFKSSGATVQK